MPVKSITKDQNFVALIDSLKERDRLDAARKEATNAFNRQNGSAGKLFFGFLQRENLPARTQVIIDGVSFMYTVAEASVIDPRKWFKLWQDGEITEDQYFSCLAVGKGDANNVIGSDQIETISIVQQGKKADIRRDDSGESTEVGVKVVTPEPIERPKMTSRLTVKPSPLAAQGRKVVLK